ncbi:fumarylacetoacetate (FAA) hydrolase family protein [Lyngbya aestuarii BL J]|uniref:Fumarylacetoacetate (FAA) hydrolase family protein n=1 Tax=Lyngbya aestuarii BL J TaxID=1348334 RepID=U7QQY5_9CYAN|nr:fumarylacetoacetate (FAA) hydrolase family protein [Lyngbya aestuarii]ERT08836.1 fumarylacetoacetate (FAA) hydrolase family protein [Lyngbya aestuarii BL J]
MLTLLNNLWLRFSIAAVCATVSTLVLTNRTNAIRSPDKTSTSDSLSLTSRQERDLLSTEIIATDSSLAQQLANTYLKREPVAALSEDMTIEQAISLQKEFVQVLTSHLGPVVGYKAGLTSPIAQERFNVTHPVRGVLLQQMLLDNGAVVSANFGARPLFEADLMVRVGDDSINEATTPQEVLASLDAVIPFIELPDLIYQSDVKLNAAALVAVNVGARLGVLGQPIPLAATSEWEKRLGNIQVILFDESGQELAQGQSSALLGHPLKAVLWLRDHLKAAGIRLQPGDLLSLGTITPLMPVQAKTTIRARYIGLEAQPVEVSVSFSE